MGESDVKDTWGGVVREMSGVVRVVDSDGFVETIREKSVTILIRGCVVPYCVFAVEVAGEKDRVL